MRWDLTWVTGSKVLMFRSVAWELEQIPHLFAAALLVLKVSIVLLA